MHFSQSKKKKQRREEKRAEKLLKQRHLYGHVDRTAYNAMLVMRGRSIDEIKI